MEDGILYNLPNIEGYVLDDSVVEQGMLGSHLTHVRSRNETRRDKVMPLTPPVGQDLEDLGVVWPLIEPIKRLRGTGSRL